MTESIDGITNTEFYPPAQENFGSFRTNFRVHKSGGRNQVENEYDLKNPHILRTIQHKEPSQSLDQSIPTSNISLQIRKLINRMQERIEEEMADKFHEMERKIKCKKLYLLCKI